MQMPTECSSLIVANNCLPHLPEHSEMIINTDSVIDILSSDQAELVVSLLKIPVQWWTNEVTVPVQETMFTFGALVIGRCYSKDSQLCVTSLLCII